MSSFNPQSLPLNFLNTLYKKWCFDTKISDVSKSWVNQSLMKWKNFDKQKVSWTKKCLKIDISRILNNVSYLIFEWNTYCFFFYKKIMNFLFGDYFENTSLEIRSFENLIMFQQKWTKKDQIRVVMGFVFFFWQREKNFKITLQNTNSGL